jgi:hypothetical protein
MKDTTFRNLSTNEKALLEKLLDHEFPGRDALRVPLASVTGRQTDKTGSLELNYDGDTLADTELGCPTEGTCPDNDGGVIALLLHVKNGRVRLLEILREDGLEIMSPPRPESLVSY